MEVSVLIVEDEKIVAKDIEHCLKKIGYNVCGIASNGVDALKLVEEQKPDLILMDIMLKGDMSAIDLRPFWNAWQRICL